MDINTRGLQSEANAEVPGTCIPSNDQQRATVFVEVYGT